MSLFMQTPGIQNCTCLIKKNKNRTPTNMGSFRWKEKNIIRLTFKACSEHVTLRSNLQSLDFLFQFSSHHIFLISAGPEEILQVEYQSHFCYWLIKTKRKHAHISGDTCWCLNALPRGWVTEIHCLASITWRLKCQLRLRVRLSDFWC